MTRYNVLRTLVDLDPEEPIVFELLGTLEASGGDQAIRQARAALDLLEHAGAYHAVPVSNWTTTDVERVMTESYTAAEPPTLDIPAQKEIS